MIRTHGTLDDRIIAYVNLGYLWSIYQGLELWAGMCGCRGAQEYAFPTVAASEEALICPFCRRRIRGGVKILDANVRQQKRIASRTIGIAE